MDSGSRKPLGRRALIELIVAAALVIAAPVLVATQSGQAGEPLNAPWDDIWLGDWPVLLERDPDPRSAALRERAAAALERVTNAGGDVKLAGDL
jgi:hypothetical protein